jgi:jumonji domain-containing protein 7
MRPLLSPESAQRKFYNVILKMAQAARDPLEELIISYNELNTTVIQELDSEPSPLEFMRFVAANKPFVARGVALQWPAVQSWTPSILMDIMGDRRVNVAITPNGYADAPTLDQEGNIVFAKPMEESQQFSDFMAHLTNRDTEASETSRRDEIRYAQTQNDNLRDEYYDLFKDTQRDIPFARIALARDPDAINIWIGTSKSVTAMHRDNYENIYVQIRGKKHFWLLPALCQPCVNEQLLPCARYTREKDGTLSLAPEKGATTPFPTWDPDYPLSNATAYSSLACPLSVTLEPGDMLYLPAMWYHKVSQSCDNGDVVVAVNYWYDMNFDGPLWPLCSMVRNMVS